MGTTDTAAPGAAPSTEKPIGDELSEDANRLGDTANDKAAELGGQAKDQAADAARSTSSALDQAADKLQRDDNVPGWLAGAFRSSARQIDRIAGQMDSSSPQQILGEVRSFARESPGAFLAASAAAGFAAARLLRSGGAYDDRQEARQRQTGGSNSSTSTQMRQPGESAGAPAQTMQGEPEQ